MIDELQLGKKKDEETITCWRNHFGKLGHL
jgi:hypothetical protein